MTPEEKKALDRKVKDGYKSIKKLLIFCDFLMKDDEKYFKRMTKEFNNSLYGKNIEEEYRTVIDEYNKKHKEKKK